MTGVRRAEIIAMLSLATDLAMGQNVGFGLAACRASLELAKAMNLPAGERAAVYYHALLRHAGCTAQTDALAALFGDEIAFRQNVAPIDIRSGPEMLPAVLRGLGAANADRNPVAMIGAVVSGLLRARETTDGIFAGHCEAAGRLAQRLGLPAEVTRDLAQIYERWDGKGVPLRLQGEAISIAVRVVSLVHEAMALRAALPEAEALEVIEARSGHAYDPKAAAALLDRPRLLDVAVDDPSLWRDVIGSAPDDIVLDGAALDSAIEVIADFIDLKAPVIAGHSRTVAALARAAAERARLPVEDVVALYRAGLLHDLGYTAVPAQQRLRAPGEQGRLHPYYGERLLSWSSELSPLGRIIADHHERLDGSGFHRGARAGELSLLGRFLAAAEAYQSLVEDRPFRVTLGAVKAAERLREGVKSGTLDGPAVDAVLDAAGQDSRTKKPALPAGLTTREVEILRRIAVGTPVKQIARDLGISPKTVGNHVQNLYAKIGVSTRAGATLFAVENGLLRPGGET